jgi:hypothetical protein
MPSKLSTLVSKISAIPNPNNARIIDEFYHYMQENGASEKHMINELQTVLYYSAFICPLCSYVRYVNPTNRNEMSPGSSSTEPGIPTLDGLTDQQSLERESGGRRKKPIIRSIGDPRLRSQYSSSAANRRFADVGGIRADAETRAWAQNHNASIVAYSEKVLQDSNNVVSSKELKRRDKF